MNKPLFYVDFNEMLEPDLVLLSVTDAAISSSNEIVHLSDGLEVAIYTDDLDEHGQPDNLVASGIVERNRTRGWGAHVKWCCRIDAQGIKHQSDF
jgi:hypothetical protein